MQRSPRIHPRSPRLRAAALAASIARFVGVAVPMGAALSTAAVAVAAPPDADEKHVVAIYVENAKNDDVRAAITKAFPEGVEIIPEKDVKAALGRAGIRTPMAPALAVTTQKKLLLPRLGKTATDLKADGIVIGRVKQKGMGAQELELIYVEAGASDAAVDSTVALDAKLEGGVASALETEAAPMRPKPKEEAPKEETPKPEEPKDVAPKDDKAARPKNTHGREILDVFAGFDLSGRFFGFTDPLTSNLRDYDVFPASGIAISAAVYPMAMLDVPVVQGLGVVGDFRIALGLGSETTDGTTVDTTWNRFDVGLRFRQALAKQTKKGDKAVVLGVQGTFGREAFTLEAAGPLGDEAPGVEYLFLRGGLDATFPAGPILLHVGGGYLGALSAGSVYERMRGSSIGGADITAGVTVPIALGFEARFVGEYIRWFYGFDPRADDKYVAGGAVDQYLHLQLGPAYVF